MGCTGSKQARLDRRNSSTKFPTLQRSTTMTASGAFHRSRSKRRASADYGHNRTGTGTSRSVGDTPGFPSAEGLGDGGEKTIKRCPDDKPMTTLPIVAAKADPVPGAKAPSEAAEKRIMPLQEAMSSSSPQKPETIDAWELMAGLDDPSPIRHPGRTPRSLSCHVALPPPVETDDETEDEERHRQPEITINEQNRTSKHVNARWVPPSQRQLERHRHSLDIPSWKRRQQGDNDEFGYLDADGTSIVRARIRAFQEEINARKAARAQAAASPATPTTASSGPNATTTFLTTGCPPGGEDKVVFYFTSLRGVRKTYEDCYDALLVLKGYGIRVDERDVSMHAGFKDELVALLGPDHGGGLPSVFACGRYIGGSEVVRQMHEEGRLKEVLEGCTRAAPRAAPESKGGVLVPSCRGCGDARFVPCASCSGSCKLFVGDTVEANSTGGGEEGRAFKRCPHCNENGLVRCPVCCES